MTGGNRHNYFTITVTIPVPRKELAGTVGNNLIRYTLNSVLGEGPFSCPRANLPGPYQALVVSTQILAFWYFFVYFIWTLYLLSVGRIQQYY